MHDASKVLLGTTQSSDRPGITNYASDPASFPAGTAVRLGSDGLLTTTKGTNQWVGISLGKSLSDIKKTSVIRAGSRIPMLLTDDSADYAYVVKGEKVEIDDASGLASMTGEGINTTTSDAVFVSGPLDGVTESGTTVKVALVDIIGGL